ncbi:MAG: hypothetical protein ACI86L_000499 [Dokdonia sp.]|jgi:DNA-binding beta-propeller fold protein YncE
MIMVSCKQEPKIMEWQLATTVALEGVNPIGIAQDAEGIWLSDGDHNRVVQINDSGEVLQRIDSLDRPMHITAQNGKLFIPQYGNDQIMIRDTDKLKSLVVGDSLDAPAGVAVDGSAIAIADFYNHRIVWTENGSDWTSFGQEGNAHGDFYYPTDVHLTKDRIYVADAYNNRVQVFDRQGNFLNVIGEDQKMNAATGLYVDDASVFVTDFENNRVLVFDTEGNLKQEIKKGIAKPTDILMRNGQLLVANYKDSSLSLYDWKEAVLVVDEESHDHDDHDHE